LQKKYGKWGESMSLESLSVMDHVNYRNPGLSHRYSDMETDPSPSLTPSPILIRSPSRKF